MRQLWKPILDQFKVDLVLSGHDHTYSRTGLIETKNIKNEEVLSGYTYKIKLCEDFSSPDNKSCNIQEREVIVISALYYKSKAEREAIKVKEKNNLNALKNI